MLVPAVHGLGVLEDGDDAACHNSPSSLMVPMLRSLVLVLQHEDLNSNPRTK